MTKRKGFLIIFGWILLVTCISGCGRLSLPGMRRNDAASFDNSVIYRQIDTPFDKKVSGQDAGAGATKAADTAAAGPVNVLNADAEGSFYFVLYEDGTDQAGLKLCMFDSHGGNARFLDLPFGKEGEIVQMCVSPGGKLILLSEITDPETWDQSWELKCVGIPEETGEDPKVLWEKDIPASDEFYPGGLTCTQNETILLSGDILYLYSNEDGADAGRIETGNPDSANWICTDTAGRALHAAFNKNSLVVSGIDPETGRLEKLENGRIPVSSGCDRLFSGAGGYDLFFNHDDGITGARLDGSGTRFLLSYLASDLDLYSVRSFCALSEDSMLFINNTQMGGTPVLLRHVDPAEIDRITTVTLGCTHADTEIRRAVIDFNKKASGCRVLIKEYPPAEDGTSPLNMDIIAGNAPDLIMADDDMSLESYASKGVFEDLDRFFLEDTELSKNEYLDNVLDAFRIGGKMYFVTPSFVLNGLVCKKADFDSSRGVRVDLLEKIISDRGLKYDSAMGQQTRFDVMDMVMYSAADQFIDWDRGSCRFNSDDFVSLLEFAKKFPKKIKEEDIDTGTQEAAGREGSQILTSMFFYSFDSYIEMRYGFYGEEIAYKGFPGSGENGPGIETVMKIAMNHDSDHKEACWEFLRYLYSKEYQKGIEFGFPVEKSVLNEMAEQAMKPRYSTYLDLNNKLVTEEERIGYRINGAIVYLPLPSREDVNFVLQELEKADTESRVDPTITKIVAEETGPFFAGQKSARETADIIQSRVQIYIRETK